MKLKYTIAALALSTAASQAVLTATKDYDTSGTDFTGVVSGAWVWGMDKNPINNQPNVDLDANGTKDFHESGTTAVNTSDGLASNTDGGLFRWDYGGSPSRAAGLENSNNDYTFELSLNLLGTGNEGSRGVFGVALEFGTGTSDGRIQFEIGEDSMHFGTGTNITGLDPAIATSSNLGSHIWRFAFDSTAQEFFIYKDGDLIDTGLNGLDATGYTGTPGLTLIGDYSGGLAGDWTVDYIALDSTGAFAPVPEPTTTALLGLGGLALILRRRK